MVKRTAKAEIVDVPAVIEPDEQLAAETARAVVDWLGQAKGFFRTARGIEQDAKGILNTAQSLAQPASAADDEQLQVFIKGTSVEIKNAEAHWSICQQVSRFHKLLTAARARAVDPLTRANAIGNDLHNRYVDAERRRVAQEQERIRREAEAQAAAIRAAELAQMELEAAEAEANSPALSERERTFADLALATRDTTGAARRAGYKDPFGAATRLLASPKVVAYMKGRQEAEALRRQAEAVRALPLEVVETERVEPQITRGAGVRGDRTTVSAEITDPGAFVRAVLGGAYGIPSDTLVPDQTVLNGYARSLGKLIERWPGIRLKTSTKVV